MEIPEIAGMAVGGSFATGAADAYSDLDLKIVGRPGAFAEVAGALDSIVRATGTEIARFSAEHVGLPEMLIVLYDDLIHIDLYPIAVEQLAERIEGMPCLVLWERDNLLSEELGVLTPSDREVDLRWMEARMWTWAWYTQSKILRGELYEAFDALHYMRQEVLFPLLAATRGVRTSGARRIDELMEGLGPAFAETVPTPEPQAVMGALRATFRLYVELADPLMEARGITRAGAAREVVLDALAAGLEWRPRP